MIHSLNFRLLAAFGLVIIIIIGAAFFFAHRAARAEIGRIGEQIDLSQVTVLGLWNPSDQAEEFVPCELIVDDIRFE